MQKRGVLISVLVFVLIVAGLFVMFGKSAPVDPAAALTEAPATIAATETPTEATTAPVAEETAAAEEAPAAAATETTTETTAPAATTATAPAAAATETPAAETATETKTPDEDDTSLLAAPKALQINVMDAMTDRPIGKADAPVTIIEYASMTCPHCAHFSTDILPEIKKQLIDTGKARMIFRDFPLDSFALKASMLARCADGDKYQDLIEVIFKNQQRWVQSEDPVQSLKKYGALAGMDEDYMNACINSEELQAAVLHAVQQSQEKYQIKSTPTFVFNEGAEIFNGGREVKDFVETVEKLSKGK